MVNYLVIVGIIAVVAGLIILFEPAFLSAIVAILLIAGGAVAIYVGSGRARVA